MNHNDHNKQSNAPRNQPANPAHANRNYRMGHLNVCLNMTDEERLLCRRIGAQLIDQVGGFDFLKAARLARVNAWLAEDRSAVFMLLPMDAGAKPVRVKYDFGSDTYSVSDDEAYDSKTHPVYDDVFADQALAIIARCADMEEELAGVRGISGEDMYSITVHDINEDGGNGRAE